MGVFEPFKLNPVAVSARWRLGIGAERGRRGGAARGSARMLTVLILAFALVAFSAGAVYWGDRFRPGSADHLFRASLAALAVSWGMLILWLLSNPRPY